MQAIEQTHGQVEALSCLKDGSLRTRVLKTIPESDQIRSVWNAWAGHRDSEGDFFLTVLRANEENLRPHVVVVERGDVPEAVLVGRIVRSQIEFRVGYLRFKSKAVILYFVHGGPRGSSSGEVSELLVAEVMRCLEAGEADVAYLNLLKTDSELYKAATSIPGFLTRDHVRLTQPHFCLAVPSSKEQLYKGLSSKSRQTLRRQSRKLVEAFGGAVRVESYRQESEVDNLVRVAEQIAKKSYQRGIGVGFNDTPETRERLQLAARKGWLRGYVLYLADHPAAYWIGSLYQGTFLSDYLAHDPADAKHSPGMYLVMNVIESFCGDGQVKAVDFAPGEGQYKQVLGNVNWQEAPIYIFSRSWTGLKLSLFRFATARINRTAKTILARTAILRGLKKYWRSRASNTAEE